jgi:hypothetical protein
LLGLYSLIDFLAVHGELLRRADAKAYLISFRPENRHGNVITYHDFLADTSCEN